ncbi:MAG TPA: bifunctional (p)ppGpp synthetase/guanosine-3',5'-bis(diphosphate) 3'-pyrophosphohydrolase [Bryobacteraceae bacterium]|jgi:GTP pyrophosphokinase|nr:bifunctional (p)ppGpp synthetase/guanosine-3',5'-bis(diphosphate) 3'-pyrophosphohydrolase [Bryobacteraceae bacterium]
MSAVEAPSEALLPATDPDTLYQELEAKVREARPNEDLAPLRKAYDFATAAHGKQERKTGQPYMIHPLYVTHILADQRLDLVTLETGLLHDTVEDTKADIPEIRKQFGEDVARCVDGVTKLSKLNLYSREERQSESIRKMLLAMSTDIRVILVKLADRLHNMRTLAFLEPERRERISRETLEIYAPIAHRLGMGKIRGELEDLAFQYIEPEASADLIREIDSKRHANEIYLKEIQHEIEVRLARDNIPARVEGRAKRAYSVYQKLKRQKITLDQVYDLLAIRIITDSVRNCYGALGIIHGEWRPIQGRIKDFIAMPRPNGYQSLHTSVIGPGGHSFEVQIRTEEMHRLAEEGIAAHWKYKEGKRGPHGDDQRIAWLRQIVEWQRDMRDPAEFKSTLRLDLQSEEVFAFTPRGRVIPLPRSATPVDFAYAIHSDVGNTCVGAKVNGRIVPLKYPLNDGDVVEILTQPGHVPSRDWLALVKTSRARHKIRHYINAIERARAIEVGQKYLEREARRLGVQMARIGKDQLEAIAADYGCSKSEDLYAALGFGKFSPRQVLQRIAPDRVEEPPAPEVARIAAPQPSSKDKDLVIRVKGIDDPLMYRARCCNPIPGEPIVGYVTRGKGVAVHSVNCSNVQSLLYESERKIDVEWARVSKDAFPIRVRIHTDDRPGLLAQITSLLATEESNIRSLEASTSTEDKRVNEGAVIDMSIEIHDKKQLEKVISGLRRISGVRDVERTQ